MCELVIIFFGLLSRMDIQTHTYTWTQRHTFWHPVLIDLEDSYQGWVFNGRQKDDTTNWKDHNFSWALVWWWSWAGQYSTNVVLKIVSRCSVFAALQPSLLYIFFKFGQRVSHVFGRVLINSDFDYLKKNKNKKNRREIGNKRK